MAGIVEDSSIETLLEDFDGKILDAVMEKAGISRGWTQDVLATLPREQCGLGILRVSGMHREGLLILQRKLAEETVDGAAEPLKRLVQHHILSLPPIQLGLQQGLETEASVDQGSMQQMAYGELHAAVQKAQRKGHAALLQHAIGALRNDGQPGMSSRWALVVSGQGLAGKGTKAFLDPAMFSYASQYCPPSAYAALVRAALGQNPYPSSLASSSPQMCACGHTHPLQNDPGHALACKRQVGLVKARHDAVAGLLAGWCSKLEMGPGERPPKVTYTPVLRSDGGQRAMADIMVVCAMCTFLIDVTVANPAARDAIEDERRSTLWDLDAATDRAQRRKEQFYNQVLGDTSREAPTNGKLVVVPFCVDGTGRLGLEARAWLATMGNGNPEACGQLKKDISRTLAAYVGRLYMEVAAEAKPGMGVVGTHHAPPRSCQ